MGVQEPGALGTGNFPCSPAAKQSQRNSRAMAFLRASPATKLPSSFRQPADVLRQLPVTSTDPIESAITELVHRRPVWGENRLFWQLAKKA